MNRFFVFLLIVLMSSCKKKEDPQPPYYFLFQVDGVQYDYEYECDSGLFGGSCSLGALVSNASSAISNIHLYGFNPKERILSGEIRFELNKDDFRDYDTIYLDGTRNFATIRSLSSEHDYYNLMPSSNSRIIFLKKEDTLVEGLFEFDAALRDGEDTVHITNGSFLLKFVGD